MVYGNDDFVPVILGTNLNAYNIARSLHEAFAVRSLALGRFAVRETAHSKIVGVHAYRDFDRPQTIVDKLFEVADGFPGRKLVLFPTIEFYANVVLDRWDELTQRYTIPLPGPALAARLMNKVAFYRTCEQFAVPYPKSIVVRPAQGGEPDLEAELPFPYPVILKPSNTDTYPRIKFADKKKVYVAGDAAELRSIARKIFAAGYADDLIVQELLTGDESVMRVANTYSDHTGTTRFVSLGQVALTEYDPKQVGNNNAIIPIEDDSLDSSLRRLLDAVGYVGLANFDIMLDRRTGLSKLLEINLRPGATSYYTAAAGENLIRRVIDDLVYDRALPLTVTRGERLWLNVPYPIALRYTPGPLRTRMRRSASLGKVHTLKYHPDLTARRRLDIARIDLRHTLDCLKYAKYRPR